MNLAERCILVNCIVYLYGIFCGSTLAKADCDCGKSGPKVTNYIVGGSVAEPTDFPWMAVLLDYNLFLAGGTLINDRYVLTAGHVIDGRRLIAMKVVFGVWDRITLSEDSVRFYDIDKFILHPSYHKAPLNFDIALIKLSKEVTYIRDKIWPICLPQKGLKIENIMAVVAGWGYQEDYKLPSRFLKKADIRTMDWQKCKETPFVKSVRTLKPKGVVCGIGWYSDSCQGDSGGPLMIKQIINEVPRTIIIGIVSYGAGCAQRSYPATYTDVLYFLEWINSNTADAKYCNNPTKS